MSDPSFENPPVLISLLDDGATLAAFGAAYGVGGLATLELFAPCEA